jgi:hypothetical protein
MVVTAGGLESEKYRISHRPAGKRKSLADAEVVEPALFGDHSVAFRIEALVAHNSPACVVPYAPLRGPN